MNCTVAPRLRLRETARRRGATGTRIDKDPRCWQLDYNSLTKSARDRYRPTRVETSSGTTFAFVNTPIAELSSATCVCKRYHDFLTNYLSKTYRIYLVVAPVRTHNYGAVLRCGPRIAFGRRYVCVWTWSVVVTQQSMQVLNAAVGHHRRTTL